MRMPGVVIKSIGLPPHVVSELDLAWRAADEQDSPVVERYRQMRGADSLGRL
ncbi:hypothetical protein [Variovorax sp. dw_308]|uniref:hypothetical protein n=1 Tax=Variovorax sp. dw_308 TaxID=2721546 RepID=UPI001C443617|nr:hypothetical protein [Variovorax sp. dw_308]